MYLHRYGRHHEGVIGIKKGLLRGFTHKIDSQGAEVEILPLADLHIGDANANWTLIRQLVQSVLDNENRYAILAGDLMNTAIIGSKSDSYSETMRPSEQLTACYDLLMPIRHKILAIASGNHEERISRTVGVDMSQILAKELGLEHLYSATSALVFVKVKNEAHKHGAITYTLYVNHGHGGGRRAGGKANALADFSSIIDCDIILVGHTHMPLSFKQQVYRVDIQNGCASLREQLLVNTASALSYGGYGSRQGYQPASNSYPVISLSAEKHEMKVTI